MLRNLLALSALCVLGHGRSFAEESAVLFNRDIRPILSENCYHCHGPDESARGGELRLDTEEGAKDWAIVEGDAEGSELIARVESDDPDSQMPPPDSERSLTEKQKQLLRQWIDQGAKYQKHWSFEPPREVRVPDPVDDAGTVGSREWGENPIDRFVLNRLLQQGLRPAPQADRETLLRRLTFDLIGVPPTLDEMDEYLADSSDRATERVIDRLLADPRFGERMAADWLDAARYSDTYGYQVDRDRFVWPYRDWVVRAFNRNLSYAEFLTEQLAGDLLPDASREQILATTFSRLHPQKVEGGSVPEEFRIEYVSDRSQTVGTAFLGLTMECCRCHSHKYDPISQTEYYQLAAFFANIDEAGLYSFFTPSVPTPTLTLPTESQEAQLQRLLARVKEAEATYDSALAKSIDLSGFDRGGYWAEIPVTQDPKATEKEAAKNDAAEAGPPQTRRVDRFYLEPVDSMDFETDKVGGNQLVPGRVGKAVELTGDDAVNLKKGNFRRDQPFSVSLWIKTPDLKDRAVIFHRSRAWTDAASRGYQLLIEKGRLSWSLIHFWPGNAIRIQTADPLPLGEWVHVAVTTDGSSSADGLRILIDGRPARTEVVRDHLTKNITGGGGDHIAIGQRFRDRGFTSGQVDSFRVFDRELTGLEIQRLASPDESLDWLEAEPQSWSDAQRDLVKRHLLMRHDQDLATARDQLASARREQFKLEDSLQEIMVMRESPGLRQTRRLERGAYDSPAEPVEPGTPGSILPMAEGQRPDRLGLSRWMLRADNPLTSRVAINRLWQLCFGAGLVRTPEDFGSQGELPTHPELLDWLSIDLMRGDWDVKRMLKQIMMSATYQQSSEHPDPAVWSADPENRWLSRQNAYRLPAEMLRDQALAVSGELVSQIGGAPVKPYEVEASFKPSKRDNGAGLYRRSLYTYWKRTGPAPAMMTLDAAKRDVCRVRRERTSSPLQAFVLLNGPQYVEAARSLAIDLVSRHGGDDDAILVDAFRVLTSRTPSEAEREVVRQLYQEQMDYFRQHPDRAGKYLAVGESRADASLPAGRLAAVGAVIGTLMNFDECVMKR